MHLLESQGRFACRPRWACADVISMKAGEPTYFDEVKTDVGNPYVNFRPARRRMLSEMAQEAGAVARLVWWPPRARHPTIIEEQDWPSDRLTLVD